MAAVNSENLATRISFEIIKEMAPKELPLFDDFREQFAKNPTAFSRKSKKGDKAMGFAIPAGTTQLLTSFVLPVVTEAIKDFTAKKTQGTTPGIGTSSVPSSDGPKAPSSDELKEMRTQAYNNAVAMGVPKEKAAVMADALVGKMVMLSK